MPGPSGISAKSIGLLSAGLLTIIFTIVIWVSVSSSPETPETHPEDFFPSDTEEIPNIEETQTGGAMLVTMVDPKEPTRISATLRADRFEPIGEGRRRLENPESWIYLRDGRAIKVTANFATMLMPDPNQPPDSGTLEGDIRIETYASTPSQDDNQLDTQSPELIAEFEDSVEFERRYLRLRSGGKFNIESDQFAFSGSDLTVILNELKDRVELVDVGQGDQIVIYANKTQDPASSSETKNEFSTPASAQESSTTSNNAQHANESTNLNHKDDPATHQNHTAKNNSPQTPRNERIFERYHIELLDDVVMNISNRGVAYADILDLWMSLDEGALPANAIRPVNFVSSNTESNTQSATQTDGSSTSTERFENSIIAQSDDEPITTELAQVQDVSLSDAPTAHQTTDLHTTQVQPQHVQTQEDGSIIITWSGALKMRPIDDESPSDISDNLFAAKLSAQPNSGIRFESNQQQINGQAASATFLGTQSIIQLESSRSVAGMLKIDSARSGTLTATALHADLAQGMLTMNGRGSMSTLPQDINEPESAASIQWNTRAQINLARLPVTSEETIGIPTTDMPLTDRLDRALFEGVVIARQSGHTIGAKIFDAQFDPNKPSQTSLTHLHLTEGMLSSASRSILSGMDMKIDFAPDPSGESISPTMLISTGNVVARTPEQMLKAANLEVQMTNDLSGDIVVEQAIALGNDSQIVHYTDAQRSTAKATKLEADTLNEIMVLHGSPAQVGQGGSKISGDLITLNGKTRGVVVDGAGTFEHSLALEGINSPSTNQASKSLGNIHAHWDESMRFDDASGSILCIGDVQVVSTPDAYTLDTLKAHRMEIKLSPNPSVDPINQSTSQRTAQSRQSSSDRQLLSARIFGRAPVDETPIPASVESRTYDQLNHERQISSLYLEGSQMFVDNQNQTLDIPVSGKLLVFDRSDEQAVDQTDSPTDALTGTTGNELTGFSWNRSFKLNREQGIANMIGDVQVVQKSLVTGKKSNLWTDELEARFDVRSSQDNQSNQDEGESSSRTPQTNLISVDALGTVRFIFEGRELLADRAMYNAIEESLFADAIGNKLVTLYSENQRAPMSARTLSWDLKNDRIEINAPTPTRVNSQKSTP